MTFSLLASKVKAPYEILPLCTDIQQYSYFQLYLDSYNSMIKKLSDERKQDILYNTVKHSEVDDKLVEFRKKLVDIEIQKEMWFMNHYYKLIVEFRAV